MALTDQVLKTIQHWYKKKKKSKLLETSQKPKGDVKGHRDEYN